MTEARIRLPESAPLLLVLATLFWGGNAVVGKLGLNYMSSMEMSFWRWLLALLFLLPFALKPALRDLGFYRANPGKLLLLGILSVSVYNSFQYIALQWTTAINVGVVSATMPLQVYLLTWLMGQERAGTAQRLGLGLALFGVLCVISRGELATLLQLQFNPGDLVMLAAVFCFALYSVLMRRMIPPEINRLGLLLVLILIGVLGILPFYLWDISQHPLLELSPGSMMVLLYIGLFPSLFSYYLWNKAVALGGANQAGLFSNLISVFASLLAVVFLGEQFTLFHALGMTGIFSGILVATYGPRWLG